MSRSLPALVRAGLFGLLTAACDDVPPPPTAFDDLAAREGALAPPAFAAFAGRCVADGDCRRGFVCDLRSCDAELGVCVPLPAACGHASGAQCACDGVTYASRCARLRAGAALAHQGACDSCRHDLVCAADELCLRPACGAAGVCEPRPELCTREYLPVCGCDGLSYGNECAAHAAGVSVAHAGECAPNAACCDPAAEPGQNGTPLCIEGASCCPDGSWQCNEGDGSLTCPEGVPGEVCAP